MENPMKKVRLMWAGVLLLLAAGCANRHEAGARSGESQDVKAGGGLVRVHPTAVSLADAIRLAGKRDDGFIVVAAGSNEENDGSYEIALLSHGRVKEIAVDAASGKIAELRERSVREGQEGFAADLEKKLPSAKIDLSRAVETAVSHAASGRAQGAQIDLDEGQLTYGVTVLAGAKVMEFTIDPSTGEVLRVGEATADEDHEEADEGRDDVDGMHDEADEAYDEADETGEMGEHASDGVHDATSGSEDAGNHKTDVSFDHVPAGGLPDGWKIDGTGQKGPLATWMVVADVTSPSKSKATNGKASSGKTTNDKEGQRNVLTLTSTNHDSANTFNLCWTDRIRFQNGVIEASMKPMSGKEDQGGGLIWRAKDKDDYYVCRANPLESNFRVYYVKGGRRHQLASADVDIAAGAWHKIRVDHESEHISCSLDGKKLLDVIDPTFPDAGGVGFWTKADAVSSFDGLQVSSSTVGRGEDNDRDQDDDEMDEDKR
jgi:uncharacterized membrane protein YkoI